MNLKLDNINEFRNIFQSLKELQLVEINLCISKERIHVIAMDSSHISLIQLNLDKTFFNKYEVDSNFNLGLNLILFNKILKAGGDKNSIELYYIENTNDLDITINNSNIIQNFTIPLMNISQEDFNINPEYNNEYTINNNEFRKCIQMLSIIDPNECYLQIKNNELLLDSSGDNGKTKIKLPLTEDNNVLDTERILYCYNHLNNFSKICCLFDNNMLLSMNKEFPMKLELEFSKKSNIKYYIAPKIE